MCSGGFEMRFSRKPKEHKQKNTTKGAPCLNPQNDMYKYIYIY